MSAAKFFSQINVGLKVNTKRIITKWNTNFLFGSDAITKTEFDLLAAKITSQIYIFLEEKTEQNLRKNFAFSGLTQN